MGDTYRVTIVRESGTGAEYETETIFEVAGGIAMVARIAPGALVDALRAANEDVPEPLRNGGVVAESVMDAAAAAGAPVLPGTHPFGQPAPQRRKRRTKAEIAADEAAAAAAGQGPTGNGDADPNAAAASVPAEPQVAPDTAATAQPLPATEPQTTAAPAAPYNPFEVK